LTDDPSPQKGGALALPFTNFIMKKRLFIFPGWGHRLTDKNYQELISAVSYKYDVTPLRIETRNEKYSLGSDKPLKEIVDEIKRQITLKDGDTFLGFSIGAILVYLVAKDLGINKNNLFLCSFPPLWEESDENLFDLSQTQIKDVRDLNFVKNTGRYFCGSEEGEMMVNFALSNNGKIIEGMRHELEGKYLERIISELLDH
jgi:surfactin synthase thioesterase subunit